ncbi:hypothetical protein BgAZ_204580 [Babesia gibsoni]|uniref:Uncharacterized protein n=1 Tax=Babesia gibsoni TaxID=33632 RepID=A0AAD8PE86_BABGI|nr:hypothetical protein BgAZ_204580 [Babesia gibsoni]
MYRHPYAATSLLRCKTLYTSNDENVIDMHKEHWLGRQHFANYIRKWEECIPMSKNSVANAARSLRSVELQLQAVSDILHRQRLRASDPSLYARPAPTEGPFVKSLGSKLAHELEKVVNEFDSGDKPYASSQSRNNDRFRQLERDAFQLLSDNLLDCNSVTQHGNRGQSNTIAIRNLGKDIGSEAPPYLVDNEFKEASFWDWLFSSTTEKNGSVEDLRPQRFFTLETLDKIDQQLSKYGLAVVRNVFDKSEIREIRKALHLKSSLARDGIFKIIEDDANVSAMKYTRGRIHCMLRGTSFDRMLQPLQRFWIPIVYYTLGDDIYISDIKLVSSDAMSYVEPWHRSNKNFGLNIVLALDDISETNGRLQFLPGTHDKASAIHPYKTGKVAVDLKRGDILIFDSRLLRRNTINDGKGCQSYLVYTYDRRSTPPPGQGLIKFIWDRWYGAIIDVMSTA